MPIAFSLNGDIDANEFRIVGLADGTANDEAVNKGQMDSADAAVAVVAQAGDAATLASANASAQAGDAATIASAVTAAQAGDVATLASANSYTDAAAAAALEAANVHTDSVTSHLAELVDLEFLAIAGRNILINGEGKVNQRGASTLSDLAFGHDCWHALTQLGTVAVITPASAEDIEDGFPASIGLAQANAIAQRFGYAQVIDSDRCRHLRGNMVTVSGRMKWTASTPVHWALLSWSGSRDAVPRELVNDWTDGNYTAGQFFTAATGFTLLATGSTTFSTSPDGIDPGSATVPSDMNNLVFFWWTEGTVAQGTACFSRWQLEAGGDAHAFDHRTFDETLRSARRYFQKSHKYSTVPVDGAGFSGAATAFGHNTSASTGPHIAVVFDGEMLKTPAVSLLAAGTGSGVNWRKVQDDAQVAANAPTSVSASGFSVSCGGTPPVMGTYAIGWKAEATPTA